MRMAETTYFPILRVEPNGMTGPTNRSSPQTGDGTRWRTRISSGGVHDAHCVPALFPSSHLSQEVRRAGIDTGMDHLLETLSGIKGVIDLPRQRSRNKPVAFAIRLIRRDPEQERLFPSFGLQRFHPDPPYTRIAS